VHTNMHICVCARVRACVKESENAQVNVAVYFYSS
jgi:hypothetical protein